MPPPTDPWTRAFALVMFVTGFSLVGCGGREARLVPEYSGIDDRLSCEHLQGEHAANEARLRDFTKERRERAGQNAGLVLMAPLAASSLFFLDLSDTERREADALARRNARLRQLAARNGCPALDAGGA